MRILILGGSGMLGHRLWLTLRDTHETWVTVRGSADPFPAGPDFPRDRVRWNVDALVFDEVVRTLAAVRPDLVINCIGLIKQTQLANDPLSAIRVNAMLPHQLALICRSAAIRLIHVSTDCVFSGKQGHYVESDPADATDLYGRTKLLGEVNYERTITLRTSIIGRELKARLGLIEWFLAQKGPIRGFTRAIFSGLTTGELGRVIRDFVLTHPDLHGVYHVSSEPIAKYDLLVLVARAMALPVEIYPYDEYAIDRSLESRLFRTATGYEPPSWDAMMTALAEEAHLYANDGPPR
jgi:dTDP-4-dehydrorhamnose reductase